MSGTDSKLEDARSCAADVVSILRLAEARRGLATYQRVLLGMAEKELVTALELVRAELGAASPAHRGGVAADPRDPLTPLQRRQLMSDLASLTLDLPRYVVSFRGTATRELEVSASTPREAVEKACAVAVEVRLELTVDAVEKVGGEFWDVHGPCVSCNEPILDRNGDGSGLVDADGEGNYLCRACADRIQADVVAESKPA